jgi:hypothetical protein
MKAAEILDAPCDVVPSSAPRALVPAPGGNRRVCPTCNDLASVVAGTASPPPRVNALGRCSRAWRVA